MVPVNQHLRSAHSHLIGFTTDRRVELIKWGVTMAHVNPRVQIMIQLWIVHLACTNVLMIHVLIHMKIVQSRFTVLELLITRTCTQLCDAATDQTYAHGRWKHVHSWSVTAVMAISYVTMEGVRKNAWRQFHVLTAFSKLELRAHRVIMSLAWLTIMSWWCTKIPTTSVLLIWWSAWLANVGIQFQTAPNK